MQPYRVGFDNGVSTKDFRRRIPFSQQPLSKLRFVEAVIPFAKSHVSCRRLLALMQSSLSQAQKRSGTLYHLPNPVLSLRTTFDNLRPGGYLALETQVYDHL